MAEIERAAEERHWDNTQDPDALIENLREQIRAAREALSRHWQTRDGIEAEAE